MNVVDVLAIAPYWVSLLVLENPDLMPEAGTGEEGAIGSVGKIMQVLTINASVSFFFN